MTATTPAPLEFFFDFACPYAYLASFKLERLATRFGRSVCWKPFQLSAALHLSGRPHPSEAPAVAAYLRHDCERLARLDERALRWPSRWPFDSRDAALLYYWRAREDAGAARTLAQALFAAAFAEGRDLGEPRELLAVAASAGLDVTLASAALADADSVALLEAATSSALERGVFGSPVVIVDGEAFWGSDRLWMVKRWLDWGGW